jgi:hypothetical protein
MCKLHYSQMHRKCILHLICIIGWSDLLVNWLPIGNAPCNLELSLVIQVIQLRCLRDNVI